MTISQFMFLCMLLLSGVYGLLTYHPSIMFSDKTAIGNDTIYSMSPLHEFAGSTMERVHSRLAMSDFSAPEEKQEIFLVGDAKIYSLLAPSCGKKFSCVHPLTGHIFVYSGDFEKNQAYFPDGAEEPRSLEAVLTHEMVKAEIRAKLGGLTFMLLGSPKTDGYADHIAQETAAMKPEEICRPDPKRATLARILEDRLTIEQMKFDSDSSYLSLVRDGADDDTAKKHLRKNICH